MPCGKTPVSIDEKDACGVGFIYRPEALFSNIRDALAALRKLEHRGACAADGRSGDGAGIMTAIPRDLLRKDAIHISERDAVGMIFLPQRQESVRQRARDTAERIVEAHGFCVKSWRKVPVDRSALGPLSLSVAPAIEQLILSPDAGIDNEEAELRLYVARQEITEAVGHPDFYIASLSSRSIVYKAMANSTDLERFYLDLQNEAFKSRFVVFHRRFSTNTTTRWKLAQPFRMVAHNGEINTIDGNLNWLIARLNANCDRVSRFDPHTLRPDWAGSDSSILDFALEYVIRQGDTPESALMKLIPEAYENESYLEEHPEILHFYEYFSSIQEPWDGPALMVFCDGHSLGATLDRNGLRPARFSVYEDGSILLASEAGLSLATDAAIIESGRLGPGEMIAVDLDTGALKRDLDIKATVASQYPYGQWLLQQRRALSQFAFAEQPSLDPESLVRLQAKSGFGKEDIDNIITAMALSESEPVFSMGDDTPLAVLSSRPRTIYDYFRQRFAQVTNPPIDPIRERVVMSLTINLGSKPKSLVPDNVSAQNLLLPSPVLNEGEVDFLLSLEEPLKTARVSTCFDPETSLEAAIDAMLREACRLIEEGVSIIILSDRAEGSGALPIPPLMAAGALHHELIKKGLRLAASIVVETAQCFSSHHFACLLSFGAQAVCPYLSLESIRHWYRSEKVQANIEEAARHLDGEPSKVESIEHYHELTAAEAQQRYKQAIEAGLLKVMSKMGISKVSSYVGAQIMECIGLGNEVVEKCFEGIGTTIGGLSFADVKEEILRLQEKGRGDNVRLIDEGILRSRKSGEHHRNNPELVKALHRAVLLDKTGADAETRKENYTQYSELAGKQTASALRDLLRIKSDRHPVDIRVVEPVSEIYKRFLTGGMSLGALSKEAHEALAVAMNRIGARSNSGEGGEDPLRYHDIAVESDGTSSDFPGLKNLLPGDSAASKIRQVASGRFGVTPEYLVTSRQLEIKIAQGAKPGEGGQLPGHKVSPYIASLRRTREGITLISPPPHHDIYSIEDLAQLIYDLKSINRQAGISVKLVAEKGIGTVAAGVAKAGADIIHVSGHDGGTGAAPISSIKHAGMPWELGLTETHRDLEKRGLRSRVTLRVDGGLRTGRDVIKAALLGADQFAFGTIALLSQGCIMARVCHTNNCPVGIATQKEELRKRFSGDPASVVEFFRFVAEEVRYILADMGYTSLGELVGRTDILEQITGNSPKTSGIDLSGVLAPPPDSIIDPDTPLDRSTDPSAKSLNETIVADPDIIQAVSSQGIIMKAYDISNTDRSVGAGLSGMIARTYGDRGFEGQIVLNFHGTAGQSFGAFNVGNIRLTLCGQANDYVGKGMNGGEIIIKPEGTLDSDPVVAGNTCLYGATGGRLFIRGRAGERFGVRNSSARAVVEGTGDHACEYMTGGAVVILGRTGRNFGAGMTGGIAFIFDADGSFATRFDAGQDKVATPLTSNQESNLRKLIEDHHHLTHSTRAAAILADWENQKHRFVQVLPVSEMRRISTEEGDSVTVSHTA